MPVTLERPAFTPHRVSWDRGDLSSELPTMIMPLADLTPTDRHLRPVLDTYDAITARHRSLSTVDVATGEVVDVIDEPSGFVPVLDASEVLEGEVVDEAYEPAGVSRVPGGYATSFATLARLLTALRRL